MKKVIILGAGISGISSGYHLLKAGIQPVIFDKNAYSGGLCNSFTIQGFTFDTFVHLSFAKDNSVKELFVKSSDIYKHPPESQNYWKGYWVRHPVQNNLYTLPTDIKINIIKGFIDKKETKEPDNYEQWLRMQYGDYFTENFPMLYTRKYWASESAELETKWVIPRFYKPTIDEVLESSFEDMTKNTYYADEMRYPVNGGFKSFLSFMENGLDIRLNKKVILIDTIKKTVYFEDGDCQPYDVLISTLPLPNLCRCLNVNSSLTAAADKLRWTSGAIVSLGLKTTNITPFENTAISRPPALWFYVYDEDIPPARVYYPHRKSPYNVPQNGYSSLQAEIYFDVKKGEPDLQDIKNKTIDGLIKMGVFNKSDLIMDDIRSEKYANVIFDHNIYKCRSAIHDYLNKQNILYAGRFGEWDYLWSDQSLLSGKRAAEQALSSLID